MSYLPSGTWFGKPIPWWGRLGKIILPIVIVLSLVVSAFGILIGSHDIATWGMVFPSMILISAIFSTFCIFMYNSGVMASLGVIWLRRPPRKYKVEKLSDSIPALTLGLFVTLATIFLTLNIAKLFAPILGDSWSLLGLVLLIAELIAVQWYRGYVRRSRRFRTRRAPEVPPGPPPPT